MIHLLNGCDSIDAHNFLRAEDLVLDD